MQIKVLYKKLMAISPYSSRDSFIYTLEMVKQYTWETEKCSQYWEFKSRKTMWVLSWHNFEKYLVKA